MAAATLLAFFSQKRTELCKQTGAIYRVRRDYAYLALVVILILFAGLRTQFNDTGNYITGFRSAQTLRVFLRDPSNLNLFKNPAFYFVQSCIKSLTDNPQVFIFLFSVFSELCIVRFIKRYSGDFAFSIFLFITLGTFCFTMAAIKQVTAMAILTFAFPLLEDRKWVPYLLVVFLAMLFHTYAILFIFLPLFRCRPWSAFTYAFAAVLVIVMLNLESTILTFMERANSLGKTIAEYEIFDDHGTNLFRVAVYAVIPLISFLFQRRLFSYSGQRENTLVHMSIISLAFMTMGTTTGANMFGRMANYFELGLICVTPWMLDTLFTKRSYRTMRLITMVCFLAYFTYAYKINLDFSQAYHATSLWQFIRSLI